MNNGDQNKYAAHRKAVPIVVAVLLTAAVTGYFMGLRQITSRTDDLRTTPPARIAPSPAVEHPEPRPPTAVDYGRMSKAGNRPNAAWRNHLDQLVQPAPEPPPSRPPTAEERAAAREERATNRAYDGAPPTVPHPIHQLSSMSCLACHGEGAAIKDRIAARVSHPHWQNCTQCHVPSTGSGWADDFNLESAPAANRFIGTFPSAETSRAYPDAPPGIPHPVALRNDCLSCHGPTGQPALRTTHPERLNCLQCHAPSARLDQRVLTFQEPDVEELIEFIVGLRKGDGP